MQLERNFERFSGDAKSAGWDLEGGPAWDCFSEEALLRKLALDIC